MKSRNLGWLAWGIVGLFFVLIAIGFFLQAHIGKTYFDFPLPALVALYSILGIWVVLGALIVMRHPEHPVGWLLCIGMSLPALDPFAFGYVVFSLHAAPDLLPGTTPALLWLNWSGMPSGVYILTIVMLLFPTGKLLSSRWRGVQWAATVAFITYLVLKTLEPGPVIFGSFPADNPVGLPQEIWGILEALIWTAAGVMVICYAAAWWSLIIRLRTGGGDERQQVKWIIPPATLFGIGTPIILYGEAAKNFDITQLGGAVHMVAIAGVIIGSSISIFKYHLYDIDIIINRTLVYGALTGTLAFVYFVLVTLLQNLLSAFSGPFAQGWQETPFAIVVSTLVIAVLFNPLRRRIQRFIDHRFYRRKYDAARTLEAFSASIRENVDLLDLSEVLLTTVLDSLQPEHASLWLHDQAPENSETSG
ncbi:MAG: hypothetical protein R3335_02595 [Anaerolineales bacterium]|nr:hypothetical protein [Anaerolineales bacterium]